MKYNTIILTLAAMSILAGCRNEDWEFQDYKYTTVYYSYQTPVRTLILGEDFYDNTLDNEHKCKIMARTGGAYSNKNNIVIDVEIDESLCDGWYFGDLDREIKVMPRNYYNYEALKKTQILIPAGSPTGGVTVELTDEFFKDKDAVRTNYVIPMVMTNVNGADSILQGKPAVTSPDRLVSDDWIVKPKDYILYGIKYVNPWDGIYLRRGKEQVQEDGKSREIVRHAEYVEKNDRCKLSTKNLSMLTVPLVTHDRNNREIPFELLIEFDEDNTCIVSHVENSSYTIQGTGKYVVDGDKNSWGSKDQNALFLEYTLTLPNNNRYQISDTLTFLSRGTVVEEFTPVKK